MLNCGTRVLEMIDNTSLLIQKLELLTNELTVNKKAVKETELKFNEIFTHSNLAVTLVGEDGRFIKSNGKLEKILGYSAEEISLLTYQDITHIDDLYLDMKLAQSLMKYKTAYSMIKRYYKKDTSVVWVLLMVSKIAGYDGKLRYYLAQVLDLTPLLPLLDVKEIEKARNSGDASMGIWEQ